MTFVLDSRPQTVAALIAFVALAALGFLPLFGGPGYEISLAAGLLLPSLAAVAAALDTTRRRVSPFDSFSRGAASGAILAVVGYATTLIHGIRAGFCDPVGGTTLFALGPGLGAVMGGVFGALVGELLFFVSSARARKVLAFVLPPLGPVLGILLSVWRFYITPTIFAFDPFFGFFSGTLYDTVIEATVPLLTYRAGSLLTLVAAGVFAAHLVHDEVGKPALRSLRRPGLPLLGAACATGSLLLNLEGWRLGHWQTAVTIERDLGARLRGERCDVVYPRSMRLEEVELFARDCDAQLAMVERYFESGDTGRVTAFLFRGAGDKRRLMGAGDTFIAKPWRHEVYLQPAGFPHPVLGHELAHVVAGSFAPGPLHIAASFGGLKPNPGLIEGVAVAASPDDDALTPSEWSRAMLDLDLLPPLASLFSFDFLGQNASKSYTVAGAFVRFVHDKFGAAAVRAWYGGSALPVLAKVSWPDLDKAWRAELARLKLPDAAAAVAKARFDRPSVWGRRCPHKVDLYRREAEREQDRGDLTNARRAYEDLLKIDPHDEGARLGLANCLLRHGDRGEATRVLSELAADEGASRLARNRALSQLADLDFAGGDYDKAAERYAALAARTLDEDALRTIEVKVSSLSDPRARRAIGAYLVGSPDRGIDAMSAGALLGAWIAEDPSDGLPEYLLGRDLAGKSLWGQAAERYDRALAKRLPPGRVLREALRQRVIVACALGDVAAARRAFDIWTDKGAEPFRARREAMSRLIERCAGVRRAGASSGMK
jgi:tetratricopeptide (TPR) repeat protein